MERLRLTSPSVVRGLLSRHGERAKKRFGQNFLIDANILEKIVLAAEVGAGDTVLEVGPGIGALTQALAESAGEVVAVEIDRSFLPVLAETLARYTNVRVVSGDILRIDLAELLQGREGFKVVANLPYYITTPVMALFLESSLPWERMVVMVQSEVADRLVAPPGGKDYGPFSVLLQYHSRPEIVTRVSRNCFLPSPAVDSAVVRLIRRATPAVAVPDEQEYFRLVRAAFAQRRKTLINSLSGAGYPRGTTEEALRQAGVEPTRRAETLSLEEFAAIARAMMSVTPANGDAGGM